MTHEVKVFDVAAPERIANVNSCASPTPVIEEGRVYVHYGTYGTACLDTETGNEIWRHSYPAPLVARMFEGGAGATPTVADGMVFTLGRQGRAFGLKADTGEVVWDVDTIKLTGAKQPYWATP